MRIRSMAAWRPAGALSVVNALINESAVKFARGWESFASDLVLIFCGFELPRASCNNEADEAVIGASVAHSPSQGYFKLWVLKHVPTTVTSVCASERRVSARRRLTTAWQFAGARAKGSHSAAHGRDASRRDESNKAARAQEGLTLAVIRVAQILEYRNMFLKR